MSTHEEWVNGGWNESLFGAPLLAKPARDTKTALNGGRVIIQGGWYQILGMPPIDYLANWRITLAKEALALSTMPISKIAGIAATSR